MSALCSATPWPDTCLEALLEALKSGEGDRLKSWLSLHLSGSDEDWTSYIAAVAAMATSGIATTIGRLRASGVDAMVAPARDSSLPQPMLDAELIMSMSANADIPGLVGAVDGIRSRCGLEDMAGALAAAATVMLQYEALLQEDRS